MQFRTFFAQDATGRVLTSATATITLSSSGATAAIFDVDGNSISNPVSLGSDGKLAFAAADGEYDIVLEQDGDTITIERVFFEDTVTAAEVKTLYESNSDTNAFTDAEQSKLSGIEASADVTDTANVAAAGALMDSEVTNLADVKSFDPADYATAAQGALADSAQQPPAEGAFVDGDKDKLDGIEASADVTDTANVTAAGAVMGTKTTSATDGTVGRIPQFFSNGGIFGLGANLAPTQDDFDATSKRSGFSRTTSSTTNIGSIPAGSSFGMSFVFSYDSNNFREIWGDVLDDGGLWTRKYRDVTGGYGDWHSLLLINASTGEGTHDLGVDQSVGTSDSFSYSIKTNATVRLTVSSAGDVSIGDHEADSKLDVDGAITQRPLSADPADPADGHSVQWVSDGTGSGDAGDVMMKINVGGTVKTTTLVDYSTL